MVYLKRSGGQSQYSALLEAQAESDSNTFAELEHWIAEHLTENLRVEALAERVNMSPRNFSRAYSKKRGRTPAKAVGRPRWPSATSDLRVSPQLTFNQGLLPADTIASGTATVSYP